jgi:hypothetical protein
MLWVFGLRCNQNYVITLAEPTCSVCGQLKRTQKEKGYDMRYLILAALVVGACGPIAHQKNLVLATPDGEKIGNCGKIYWNRQPGVVLPGTVLINKTVVKSTAPLSQLSNADARLVRGCNSGGHETIYAGHTQPIVQVGAGYSYIDGGGDSNVYGSSAVSDSKSGAEASGTGVASSE